MEKTTKFVLNLPPGFRFHPTDEELVMQYLKRKNFSFPLPIDIIPDVHLANFDPWDLPGGYEEERYFFNLIREAKYRSKRPTLSGYWKATSKDKPIMDSIYNQLIGMKKTFVFYRVNAPMVFKSHYVMHEYRLANSQIPTTNLLQRSNSIQSWIGSSGDWVLCRIFKKKSSRMVDANMDRNRNSGSVFIDRKRQANINGFTEPESSCITEVPNESSGEEEASSENVNSTRR